MADYQPLVKLGSMTFEGEALKVSTGLEDELFGVSALLHNINESVSALTPDANRRLRAVLDTASNINTVSTVSAVTNVAQVGGYPANQLMIAMTQLAEAELRRNILVN